MTLNIVAKFEGKTTCVLKNDMRNLANFHRSMFESLKLGTLMASFYPKQKMYELKIYMVVFVMTIENDAKFEDELTCQFKIDTMNLKNFDLSTRKSQKFAF